jgi:hypothetical protein
MQQGPEPDPFAQTRIGGVVQDLATPRLKPDERLVDWARAWVSTEGWLNPVFAARALHYLVLTDRRLMLWSCGFFTRLPQRRTFTQRLDEVRVHNVSARKGRSIVIESYRHRPLRFDLRDDEVGNRFIERLIETVGEQRRARRERGE